MSKYLYGASVQGIQDFIFKTNKLQEIVGASEIVKGISKEFEDNYTPDDIVLNAAGKIKAVFESKEACEKVVLEFSKRIQLQAYGISISQAVVQFEGDYTQDDIGRLEANLKIQRNKTTIPLDMSLNIMELNPPTAKPKISKDKDIASSQKIEAYEAFLSDNPNLKEFKDLSKFSNGKNKLAVIHIDGNGLGKLVPKLGNKLSAFSKKLDEATKKAFKDAKDDGMSVRDVVLGGDDVTVICNANDALTFTKKFLENFEVNTAKIEELKGSTDKLTACAGIAYSNEKYPFHYAVSLAEALCGQAKNASNREASCLMFHNIQSANFDSWEKIVEDELTIKNEKENIRCDFGPYYLNQSVQANISDFVNTLEAYRCEGSPISRLRSWIGELYNSRAYADRMLERINAMAEESSNWKTDIMEKNLKNLHKELSNSTLIVEKDGETKTPIYDVLQILSTTDAKKGEVK